MTTKIPMELREARYKVFQDFVNLRDKVKRIVGKEKVFLTGPQARTLLIKARKHHFRREAPLSAAWYDQYQKNVQRYLMAIQVNCWSQMPKYRQ